MKYMQSCVIFVVALFLPVSAWSNGKVGDVVSLRGEVCVERNQKNIKAKKKLAILEKDNVFTHEKARAKILFRDDSILTLGPMSHLVVEQYIYRSEGKKADSIYGLLDGKLRAVVGSPGFKVKTPTAFAAARGTIFWVWYDSKADSTGIAVVEGKVQVKNINPAVGGQQILTRGQMTSVSADQPPTIPKPFNVKAVDDLPAVEIPKINMPMVQGPYIPERFVFQPPVNQEPEAKMTTPVTVELNFPQ